MDPGRGIGKLLGDACESRPSLSLDALLTQTSGLVDRSTRSDERGIVRDGCRAAEKRRAGEWEYANVNYIAAGLIAEVLDRRTLAEQLHDAFPDVSRCYYYRPGKPVGAVAQRLPDTTTDELGHAFGAGGVVCSVNALAEIGQRLNPWLATEHHGWTVVKPTMRYGHGMYRYEIGDGPTFVHDGLIDGSSAVLLLHPQTNAVVVLVSPTRTDLSRLAISLGELLRH